MFTGLIEEIGKISVVSRRGKMTDISIEAKTILDSLSVGDSVAVNGACLTIVDIGNSAFTLQAVEETLTRTTFGSLKRGDKVNLERALCVGDRLGGHFVQGHVDGTGKITSIRMSGENKIMAIETESGLIRYIVEKGSITVDGISLTVTFVRNNEFGVSVIPHSLAATTLKDAGAGYIVNLETDILAKYIEKLIQPKNGITIEHLEKLGF